MNPKQKQGSTTVDCRSALLSLVTRIRTHRIASSVHSSSSSSRSHASTGVRSVLANTTPVQSRSVHLSPSPEDVRVGDRLRGHDTVGRGRKPVELRRAPQQSAPIPYGFTDTDTSSSATVDLACLAASWRTAPTCSSPVASCANMPLLLLLHYCLSSPPPSPSNPASCLVSSAPTCSRSSLPPAPFDY